MQQPFELAHIGQSRHWSAHQSLQQNFTNDITVKTKKHCKKLKSTSGNAADTTVIKQLYGNFVTGSLA